MIFIELRDTEIGCNSFIVGDEATSQGLALDPLGKLGAVHYLLAAQEAGIQIAHVVETHVHADHPSCARELAESLGIPLSLSRHAPAEFPYNPLRDGQVIELGSVRAEVWETPGHTPDSISLIVSDTVRGNTPWVIFTGDSLFVGDAGRPDLADASPEMIRKAAQDQYRSVHRIMTLPDYTEVHPAHYGASPCGGLFMNKKPSSTVGYERVHNRMLQIKDVDAFVDLQLQLLKPPPEEAAELRARNLGKHPVPQKGDRQ